MSGGRPMGQMGLGAKHLSIPIPKLQTCALVKISPSTRVLHLWFLELF